VERTLAKVSKLKIGKVCITKAVNYEQEFFQPLTSSPLILRAIGRTTGFVIHDGLKPSALSKFGVQTGQRDTRSSDSHLLHVTVAEAKSPTPVILLCLSRSNQFLRPIEIAHIFKVDASVFESSHTRRVFVTLYRSRW
jgi:hypothetical protein